MPQFGIVWLDEAGNQANRKLWYQTEAIDFMNYLTRIRVKGITIPVIWPDMKDIDPGIVKRAAFTVSIYERGTAIIKGLNKNKLSTNKTIPYAAKNKVALTGADAQDISERYDNALNLFTVPYYEITGTPWAKYD